mgnify:CR=1 FL=1
MATTPTFFSPTDAIDINTLLGLSGAARWIIQTASPSTSQDRASGLKADGDEAAYKEHNKLQNVSLAYKCFAVSGNLTIPSVGTVTGGYHIDSVALAYSPTDWPTLTVNAHKHDNGATHAADSCRTYTSALTFTAGFGVPSSVKEGTTSIFSLSAAGIGMRSLSFNLACTHVDELGSSGNWLAGENHDGVETIDAEFTGVPNDTADLTIGAGWSRMSDGQTEGNTAVNARTLSITRHIAADAEEPEGGSGGA